MLRQSNISLSNRALFYITKKDTLQQHEKLQSSLLVRGKLSKQEISNPTFIKLPELRSGCPQRGLRYTRVRVHSQTFQDADRDSGRQPNKYNVTTKTASLGAEKVFTPQAKSNQHNFSDLRRFFSRDVSVQWLERIGFTFSPFAFIFGTSLLFAAFANTLQKQDGKQWPRTLSQTKLPGLAENKVTQTSSWVFLESVLSQYINRDNSFRPLEGRTQRSRAAKLRSGLANTTSLAKSVLGPYGAVLGEAEQRYSVPAESSQLRGGVTPVFTLAGAKASIGTVEEESTLGVALQPKDVAERGALAQNLEIQLSPIWSQHIKKDFLGVFPLRRTSRLGRRVDLKTAPLRFALLTDRTSPDEGVKKSGHASEHGSLKPTLALQSGPLGRPTPITDQNALSSLRAPQLKKSLIWPWYQITAYHPPNRVIHSTWAESSRTEPKDSLKIASRKIFETSVERVRLEDDSIPSKKNSAYSKEEIHQDRLSARVLRVVRNSFYDYGFSISEISSGVIVPTLLTEGDRTVGRHWPIQTYLLLQSARAKSAYVKASGLANSNQGRVLGTASIWQSLLTEGEHAPTLLLRPLQGRARRSRAAEPACAKPSVWQSGAVRSGNEGARAGGRHAPAPDLNKTSVSGKSTQASSQEEANLPAVVSNTKELKGLRESENFSTADGPCSLLETTGRRPGQNRSLFDSARPSKKLYKPRLLSFTKSGGVSLLKGKIVKPKRSFWEYAHSISGYNFPELQDYQVADLYGKVVASSQSKVGLIARLNEPSRQGALFGKLDPIDHFVTKTFRVDPNKVLLTPYLVKVPPKVLHAASHKTEGLARPTRVNRRSTMHMSKTVLGLLPGRSEPRQRGIQVREVDRSRGRSVEKNFKIWYTPLELDQQNTVKKAFKEVGRDYSEYLKRPKDSLSALLLSPSLEEDKQIEEEEVQRLAQEKAAAKAAAKRSKNEEEDRISDSIANEGEFNAIDPLELSFREDKGDLSNIEQEPLNDEEIEDSRFERLRFTREVEAKNEEQASQGLALSLTCRDSTKRPGGRAPQSFRGLGKVRARGNINDNFGTFSVSERKHSFFGQRSFWPTRFFSQEERLVSTHTVTPYIRYDQNNPWLLLAPKGGVLGFAEQRNRPVPNLRFGVLAEGEQPARSVPATLQAAPLVHSRWAPADGAVVLRTQSSVGLDRLEDSLVRRTSANSRKARVRAPNRRFGNPARDVTRSEGVSKVDGCSPLTSTQNLRNLQIQARLGLVRFVHLPVVEAAYITEKRQALLNQTNRVSNRSLVPEGPQNDGFIDLEPSVNCKLRRSLDPDRARATGSSFRRSAEQRNELPATSASKTVPPIGAQDDSIFNRTAGMIDPLFVPADGAVRNSTYPSSRITPLFRHLRNNPKATTELKSENRIYKSDPRLRLTSLESSISTDWRHDRKVEASAFRISSKERPYLVLPQLSEDEWQKSMEWQLKKHFLEEDTRLEPLLATQPYKTFKVKRIERSLPWLTLEKPSFSPFQWPYKTVRVGSLLDSGRRRSSGALARRATAPAAGEGQPVYSGPYLGPYRARATGRSFRRSAEQRNDLPATSCSAFLTARMLTKDKHALVTAAIQRRALQTEEALTQACTIKRYVRPYGTKKRSMQNRTVLQAGRLRSAIQLKRPYGPVRSNDIIRLPGTFFKEGSLTLAPCRFVNYSRIPLVGSFGTYSKGRTTISFGSAQLFDVTNKIFSSQDDLNIGLLFEPPSILSWLLIYRLFLALILKEVLKYIYRISLKDFFIRIINSDFGRTITSPEFRQSVQFEPFPEFYRPKTRLKDLIGIKTALLPLSEIIWFLRNNCRSRSGPHGVVLLGPEGVNTTAIAQAVAGEAKVPIIVQSLRALTLTHTHPQKRLEKVLLLARAQSPCVLFLDELDVIGQAREGVIRSTSGDAGTEFRLPPEGARNSLISLDSTHLTDGLSQLQLPDDQATSQAASAAGRRIDLMLRLLTVMDGLHHLNGVVVITTSKNTATLDPALLRPGRFDRLIHLTLPNHESRMELFKTKTTELGHTDQIPWEYLSLQTTNMGGADIVSAINYSLLRAIVIGSQSDQLIAGQPNDTVHTIETLEYGLNCVKALNEKRDQTRYKTF